MEYKGDRKPSSQAAPPKPKRNPLNELIGERITVQNKSGALFTGTFTMNESGFLRLEDCTVTGIHHKVKSKWVLIDRTAIAHIHPADAEVSRVEEE